MRLSSAIVAIFLFLAIAQAVPTNVKSQISLNDLIRMRCSHNPDEETYFFFNGTVTAYLGKDSGPSFSPFSSIKPLFTAVGMNVAKCYKSATGTWYLVGREAMWYIDANDNIMDSWSNLNGVRVPVFHVDNDPVMQTFDPTRTPSFPGQVYGDTTILPSDVTQPLNYVNPLHNPVHNSTFDLYSPQNFYQAAELFKFISPTRDVFSDKDSVDSTIVSWTRTSLFLPWMQMGQTPGYLLYSFQGSKIPDYTHLPAKIVADIENRVPHYKHAPESKCFPALPAPHSPTGGISSWSFFKENFNTYLNNVEALKNNTEGFIKTPLAPGRQYGCNAAPQFVPAAETKCKATASLIKQSEWIRNGETVTQYDIKITNTGSSLLKTVAVEIGFANVVNAWNVKRVGDSNVYGLNLWNTVAAGSSISGSYGIQVTGIPVVTVGSVSCA